MTPSSVSSPPTSLFHQRRSPTSPASWWTSSIHQSWSSGDSSCWRASLIPSSSSSVCGDWRILDPGLYSLVINISSHYNWLSTNLRFNMMTLIILTWVGFFTLPLVYKNNQVGFTGCCPLCSDPLWSSSSLEHYWYYFHWKLSFPPLGCCGWRGWSGQLTDLRHQGESDGSHPHEEHEEGGVIIFPFYFLKWQTHAFYESNNFHSKGVCYL